MSGFGLLVLVLSMTVTNACDVDFPVQLPIIQDLKLNFYSSPSTPKVELTIRPGPHSVQDVLWWLESSQSPPGIFHPILNDQDDRTYRHITLKNGDVKVTLESMTPISTSVSCSIVFNLGCSDDLYLSLAFQESKSRFHSINAGRILAGPQKNSIFETDKSFNIKYRVKTSEEEKTTILAPAPRIITFRNASAGLHVQLFTGYQEELPVKIIQKSAQSQGKKGETVEYELQGKLSEDIQDIIVEFPVDVDTWTYEGNLGGIEYMSFRYFSTFHKDEDLAPEYEIRHCDAGLFPDQNLIYSSKSTDDAEFSLENGKEVCLIISVDGSPLPDYALAEMRSKTSVRKFYTPLRAHSLTATYTTASYYIEALKSGETRELLFVINNEAGFKARNIVLKG